MTTKVKNWNDYWFQGDELIRDFEGMYRDIEDPWLQLEKTFQPRLFVGLSLLQWTLRDDPSRKLEILDIGAGLGGPTKYLKPYGKVTASDISETAIKKAAALDPEIDWVVDDITRAREEWLERFDIIWISEVLAIVITEIDDVLKNVASYLKPNGHLIFNYYLPDNPWTSRYISGSRALFDKLSEHFNVEVFIDLNPFDGSQRELLGLLGKKSNEP